MIIPRRKFHLVPSDPLMLNGVPLSQVNTSKNLDVLLSRDLHVHVSWHMCIHNVCLKADKFLGLLYRRFYCTTPIWFSHSIHFSSLFTLRICLWSVGTSWDFGSYERIALWMTTHAQFDCKLWGQSEFHQPCYFWKKMTLNLKLQACHGTFALGYFVQPSEFP